MINETLLQFDKKTQLFTVNQKELDGIDFRGLAIEKLFNKKHHHIIIKILLMNILSKISENFILVRKVFYRITTKGIIDYFIT